MAMSGVLPIYNKNFVLTRDSSCFFKMLSQLREVRHHSLQFADWVAFRGIHSNAMDVAVARICLLARRAMRQVDGMSQTLLSLCTLQERLRV